MRSLFFAVLATLLVPAAAMAADKGPSDTTDCFISGQWTDWSAPGNGDVLLLRVNTHDIYRVQLSEGSHVYRAPDRFLINEIRGSNWICSALDLDLSVADHTGFRQGLIARHLRKLTPDEIAHIPAKDLP